MDAVNLHLLGKLDLAFRAAAKTLKDNVTAVPGLRPSHYRLLDFTPDDGIRLSQLAQRANISKQALGEFTTALQTAGLVDVSPDPSDARARLVTPTPKGRRLQNEIRHTVTALEHDLQERVGTDRWTAFCQVLDAMCPRIDTSGSSRE